MVKNSFSSIDINLMKRADLIPNLVETVKAYAAHETETFQRITELRSKIMQPTDRQTRLDTEEQMRPMIAKLLAVSEAYPDLKADSQFINLQRNLTEVEEQISASRRAYNAAVYELNNSVQSVPTNIVAQMFNFDSDNYFEADEDKKESVRTEF